jgi:hypothetical protein
MNATRTCELQDMRLVTAAVATGKEVDVKSGTRLHRHAALADPAWLSAAMPIMCCRVPSMRVRVAAPTFDFESYMKERAVMVNKALDEALPLRYPEVLVESMRWA